MRKSNAAGTLIFQPGTVDDIGFDGATPVATIGIRVQNTSNQEFTINSFAADILAIQNGATYRIGNASDFTATTIKPNSEGIYAVHVRFGLFQIVNDIINAWQYGTFKQQIQLVGNANVDNLQVPIKQNYMIG